MDHRTKKMEYFQKALRIVGRENLDWRKLAIQIATEDPRTFVEAFENLTPKRKAISSRSWDVEARRLLNEGKKIDAIKHCREITGWNLSTAKNAVEAL